MSAITQRIPDFFGGINEAPDQYKGQGQVRDAVNCIPDLTKGLYKRPGAKRVGVIPLENATSSPHWFHYYRDEVEGSYVGQVQTNGSVNMWSADSGVAVTVSYESLQQTNLQNYLNSGTLTGETLQFTTINDSTFVCNRNVTAAMTTATTDARPHTYSAFIEIKRSQNGRQYGLNIHDPTSSSLTTIKTATQVSANPTGEGYSTFGGAQGHCPYIGTKVFTLNDGVKTNLIFRLTVTGQQGPLPNSNDDSPEAGDFTCKYSLSLDLLHGGEGWTVGSAGTVTLEGFNYPINIDKIETVQVRSSIKAVRPDPTPFDQQTNVTPDSILGGITSELSGTGISFEVIGNGIYLYSNTVNFTVEAQSTDLMTVITDQVNDVTGLPFQCKHGYIVKVSNSSSPDDDYYLRFEGNGGGSGPGSWVECAEPGILKSIDPLTVPIIIQRQSNGSFQVKRFTYDSRDVGDDNTNPTPSFIGKKINKVLFFRNRLCFLSDENVILSRPGDLGNFFANTALTVSGTDPIDISCSSTFPAILFDALEVNSGLIVFAQNQQFLLATDSDILQPETAKLSSLSTYSYNSKMPPISMGTIAGFVDNAGAFSRFFAMANVAREGEPSVNELSKVISRKLDNDLDLIANSRENNFVFLGKRNSDEVFGYKYFGSVERQLQSAWFRWKHTRPISYHCVTDDTYFFVDDQNFLQKIDLIRDDALSFTHDDDTYLVHLDNYSPVTGGTYDSSTNRTSFNLTWLTGITDKKPNLTAVKGGTDGTIITGINVPNTGTAVTVPGKWDGVELNFGYDYTMQVDLPKFFVQTKTGNVTINEQRGSLTIHRVNLIFSSVGVYETELARVGKPSFSQQFSSTTFDSYLTGNVRIEDTYAAYVPVYEKSDNFTLSVKSTSPLPATLTSLTWEGDYNPSYYKSV